MDQLEYVPVLLRENFESIDIEKFPEKKEIVYSRQLDDGTFYEESVFSQKGELLRMQKKFINEIFEVRYTADSQIKYCSELVQYHRSTPQYEHHEINCHDFKKIGQNIKNGANFNTPKFDIKNIDQMNKFSY